jgi:predicted transcriptional regulator
MKTKVFTVKMDKYTAAKLAALAKRTERSRGAVVRVLIQRAAEMNGALTLEGTPQTEAANVAA